VRLFWPPPFGPGRLPRAPPFGSQRAAARPRAPPFGRLLLGRAPSPVRLLLAASAQQHAPVRLLLAASCWPFPSHPRASFWQPARSSTPPRASFWPPPFGPGPRPGAVGAPGTLHTAHQKFDPTGPNRLRKHPTQPGPTRVEPEKRRPDPGSDQLPAGPLPI
jgi:hypothetical protein